MKAIIDADGLIYASSCMNETVDNGLDYFNDKLQTVLDALSNFCEVSDVIVCNGSRNCFRKAVNDSYKENRTKDRPKILNKLHKEVKLAYNSYYGDGVETDDVVATLWKKEMEKNGVDSVVIVANDKDYKQLPCWYFDMYYRRMSIEKIDDFDACYNFFEQMIIGDTADNVNYCKGYGKSFVKKYFKDIESKFGLFRKVYYLYLEIYGTEAKDKFLECYKLLKLRTDADEFIRKE